MSDNLEPDTDSAEARCITYGRLASAFSYPVKGKDSLIPAVEYTEAFDPAASKRACSLREYSYASDTHSTALNEELLRFYHFFGLTRSAEALMPDHLSVEFEFMQFLSTLEMHSVARGDEISSLKKAQRDFLQRHLRVLVLGIQDAFSASSLACEALVDMSVEVVASELNRLNDSLGISGDVAA